MITKEIIIKEVDSLPEQLLIEVYEYIRQLKKSHKDEKIKINKFGRYLLKEPLLFDIIYDGETWCLENKEFNIVGCGSSIKEAEDRVNEDFEFLVDYLFNEDDSELDDSALKAKLKLKEIIGGRI